MFFFNVFFGGWELILTVCVSFGSLAQNVMVPIQEDGPE